MRSRWFLIPLAIVAIPLAVVLALGALFVFPVRAAFANMIWHRSDMGPGMMFGGPPWGGMIRGLPPELSDLGSVPADQRFSHFTGATVSLKDKNGNPLTIAVTPGTVSAASATSVTIATNDGSTKTFAIDQKTRIHGNVT